MIVLGLTGSIGMGKSTTAQMFRDEGIAVNDADETVHRLYTGRAAPLIEARFPGTVHEGTVDRQLLGQKVIGDPAAMRALEDIVHPLVRQETDAFLAEARARGDRLVVLDIPLLFETGGRERVDKVLVVSAPAHIQRERVMARPGMTEERFEGLLARQVPDSQKRAMADFVVDTGQGMDAARAQVRDVIGKLTGA
jgi:dephospho-CoA kinase